MTTTNEHGFEYSETTTGATDSPAHLTAWHVIDDHVRQAGSPGSVDRVVEAMHALEAAQEVLDSMVWNARRKGASWAEIGEVFGISRQAAQQRFRG